MVRAASAKRSNPVTYINCRRIKSPLITTQTTRCVEIHKHVKSIDLLTFKSQYQLTKLDDDFFVDILFDENLPGV